MIARVTNEFFPRESYLTARIAPIQAASDP